MELKQLQSFCAVVKYKSFTKAAEKLYLSQPTVSTHVRQLEEEFQTSLIIRTTKSVEVTLRGQELYECACNIVNLRDNLIRSWSDEDEKMIRIGASTIPSAYILPQILPAFRAIRPAAQFHVFQSDSQGIVDGLLCGAFDVGLIGADLHEEMLELVPLYVDRMVLITPNNAYYRRFAAEGGMTLEQICREPMLLREKGSGSKKCISAYFEKMGVDENDLTVSARLNDQESIKNLVAGGLGVSIISEKAAEDAVKEGRFLSFPLPQSDVRRQLYIATRRGAPLSGQTQQFVSFACHFYDQNGDIRDKTGFGKITRV